jgi:hypothetical protein
VVVPGLGLDRSEKRATPWVSPWWWLASVGPDLRKELWVPPEKVAGLTHRWWWWKEKKKKKKNSHAMALCWWFQVVAAEKTQIKIQHELYKLLRKENKKI